MSRLKEIGYKWLESYVSRPIELRVGWSLITSGGVVMGTSLLDVGFKAIFKKSQIPYAAEILDVLGAFDPIKFVIGALLCMAGFYCVYRRSLSPVIRVDQAKAALAQNIAAATINGLDTSNNFKVAFGYEADVPVILALTRSADPLGLIRDYKFSRHLIDGNQKPFVAKPGHQDPIKESKIWESLYFVLAVVALTLFTLGAQPWYSFAHNEIMVVIAIFTAIACVPVLIAIRNLHALSRLTRSPRRVQRTQPRVKRGKKRRS